MLQKFHKKTRRLILLVSIVVPITTPLGFTFVTSYYSAS